MLYTYIAFPETSMHAYKHRYPFCHFPSTPRHCLAQLQFPWALNSFHSTIPSPDVCTAIVRVSSQLLPPLQPLEQTLTCVEILPPFSRSYFWKETYIFLVPWCLHCHQVYLLTPTSPSTWKWTLVTLLKTRTSRNFNSKYSAATSRGNRQDYSRSCLKLNYLTSGHQALQISSKDSQKENNTTAFHQVNYFWMHNPQYSFSSVNPLPHPVPKETWLQSQYMWTSR